MKVPSIRGLQDLLDLPWVLNPGGCGIRGALERTFAHAGRTLIPALEVTGDFGTLLEFVAYGFGVTFAPRWLALEHHLADRLQAVPVQGAPMRSSFWLCWRPLPAPLAAVVQRFRQALEADLGSRLTQGTSALNGRTS